LIGRTLASGLVAATTSTVAAAICSRIENRHAARPLNAVAHIYDGGEPPGRDGPGGRNTAIGVALHTGASVWWAFFFEAIFGRRARRSTPVAVAGASLTAAAAYLVDYHVVSRRFQPGFEAHLTGRSMVAIYAALAAGFALSARLGRFHHHEVEDGNEGSEGRPAERGPEAVEAPVERR